MLERPWVTPQEVRDYSDFPDVQNRNDTKLTFDISRAEQAVISYTNNKFDDPELNSLPAPVRQAVILIAERYAHNTFLTSKEYKSETMDDWSYTVNDAVQGFSDLGLDALLDDYKIAKPTGGIHMRLRKL